MDNERARCTPAAAHLALHSKSEFGRACTCVHLVLTRYAVEGPGMPRMPGLLVLGMGAVVVWTIASHDFLCRQIHACNCLLCANLPADQVLSKRSLCSTKLLCSSSCLRTPPFHSRRSHTPGCSRRYHTVSNTCPINFHSVSVKTRVLVYSEFCSRSQVGTPGSQHSHHESLDTLQPSEV